MSPLIAGRLDYSQSLTRSHAVARIADRVCLQQTTSI